MKKLPEFTDFIQKSQIISTISSWKHPKYCLIKKKILSDSLTIKFKKSRNNSKKKKQKKEKRPRIIKPKKNSLSQNLSGLKILPKKLMMKTIISKKNSASWKHNIPLKKMTEKFCLEKLFLKRKRMLFLRARSINTKRSFKKFLKMTLMANKDPFLMIWTKKVVINQAKRV